MASVKLLKLGVSCYKKKYVAMSW